MSGHDHECKTTTFTAHGGEVIVNGKGQFPDHLILRLPEQDAWYVVNELLAALKLGNSEPGVVLLGKLKPLSEEE